MDSGNYSLSVHRIKIRFIFELVVPGRAGKKGITDGSINHLKYTLQQHNCW